MARRPLLERLVVDTASVWLETAVQTTRLATALLRAADIRVGPVELTPEGLDRLRALAVHQVRLALDLPDELTRAEPQRAALLDPTTLVRSWNSLRTDDRQDPAELVRRRFEDLLRRSIDGPETLHPAHLAIVAELAPDEARILRYLDEEQLAPVVDVVEVPLVGRSERLLAEHLSTLGERAGCRHPARVPTYLTNLARLGLVSRRSEELAGSGEYEVIEASPTFLALRDQDRDGGRRVRPRRGVVALTPLGVEFCGIVLSEPPPRPVPVIEPARTQELPASAADRAARDGDTQP